MSISPNATICREANVTETELGDEIIVLAVDSGKLFSMVDVAKDIWRATESPVVVTVVVDELLKSYDVERETCTNEVLAFIGTLVDGGLVRVV